MLDPIVDEHEKSETYPDGVFAQLGAAGLLSLPQPEEWGGGGQPFEVYLQVLEEIAARWAAVAVAVSVHSLSSHPLLTFGTDEQKQRWLPGHAVRRADRRLQPVGAAGGFRRRGAAVRGQPESTAATCSTARSRGSPTAAVADFYTLFARTGEGSRGISCFLVPGDLPGLSFGKPEEKMGLHAVPTTSAFYDNARIDADRRIGAEGQGLQIAFSALDSGRLGIAAVAVGIAQAALDEAVRYANERTTFGRKIIDHQGLGLPAGRYGRRGGQRAGHLSRRRAPTRPRPARTRRRPASPSWWPPTRR